MPVHELTFAGDHRERGKAIFEAGCDVVLHCSGRIEDMRAIADVAPLLSDKVRARVDRVTALAGGGWVGA